MNQVDLSTYMANSASLSRMTPLLREEGLRSFLLHLKASEEMPSHQTRGAITVQCLLGKALFVEGEDRAELVPGIVVCVQGGKPHSVHAEADSLMLVTVSDIAVP
jgi:quercetin dioxygenase-like cupin family protein